MTTTENNELVQDIKENSQSNKILKIMKEHALEKGIKTFEYHALTTHGVVIRKNVTHINEYNHENLLKFFFANDEELKIKVLPYRRYLSRQDMLLKIKDIHIEKKLVESVELTIKKNPEIFNYDKRLNLWFHKSLLSHSPLYKKIDFPYEMEDTNEFFKVTNLKTRRYQIGLMNFLNNDTLNRVPKEVIRDILEFVEMLKEKKDILQLLEVENIFIESKPDFFELTILNYGNESLLNDFMQNFVLVANTQGRQIVVANAHGENKKTENYFQEIKNFVNKLLLEKTLPEKENKSTGLKI